MKKVVLCIICISILLSLGSVQAIAVTDAGGEPMYTPHSCHEGINHSFCYVEIYDEPPYRGYFYYCCCGRLMKVISSD